MRIYGVLAPVLLFLPVLFPAMAGAEELACAKESKPGEIKLLKDKPVEASLTVDSSFAGVASTTIMVETRDSRFCIETILAPSKGGVDALTEEARHHVTWSAPYLLVEADTNFRQDVLNKTWVFKLRKKRLVRLGAVGGDLDRISSSRFRSLYNKAAVWQAETFECTTCKPPVQLVVTEDGGKLAVDRDATWQANQKEWAANEKIIAAKPSAKLIRALIENAVIAAYCQQDDEVKRLTSLAESLPDRTIREEVAKALKQVVPLEAPDRWNAVWEQ